MDNFRVDIVSEGEKQLAKALSLFRGGAIGYRVENKKKPPTLLLYCYESPNCIRFPTELSLDKCIPMILEWLKDVPYGTEPDHDGDNGKGWRIFNEDWGHVFGEHEVFVGIQPKWAMYGK